MKNPREKKGESHAKNVLSSMPPPFRKSWRVQGNRLYNPTTKQYHHKTP